jgi:hypothetical protein
MNRKPGTWYQRTALRSAERPEHASVIAHQRAYTAGGANGWAFGGSGAVIKSHAVMPRAITPAKIAARAAVDPDVAPSRNSTILLPCIYDLIDFAFSIWVRQLDLPRVLSLDTER